MSSCNKHNEENKQSPKNNRKHLLKMDQDTFSEKVQFEQWTKLDHEGPGDTYQETGAFSWDLTMLKVCQKGQGGEDGVNLCFRQVIGCYAEYGDE